MDKLESENFKAIAHSRLAKCFVTVDGQTLRPDSVFFVLGSADWKRDYQHMLGANGMPDGTPTLYKMNLKERLAFGTDGSAISLCGRALSLSEPVIRKTQDNGEGYNYVSSKRMARLIWETWYGKIPDGLEVDHLNRKRNDDRLLNLRLTTHSDNLRNTSRTHLHGWSASDKVLLIPMKSGSPVLVHPSDAYEIVGDHNTWKLLHGQRRTAGGWGAVLNPTQSRVRGYFGAYKEFDREGLLEKCLALVAA